MDFSGGSTAIMLALAAVLWFLYLLPTWLRRREYLATERNATRLQRAIRVMAETAELPDEVRIEANAREAVRHERLLRQEQRRTDAEARAELRAAAARARLAESAVARAVPTASVSTRLRRARRLAGLLLLASVLVAGVQLWLVASTGAVLGSWLVLAGCAGGAALSLAIQRRIVARGRSLVPRASATRVRPARPALIDAELPAPAVREWTPVAVPKPLYLERHEPPRVPVAPPVSAHELLVAAAAEAERALAAAHDEAEVVRFPRRPAPAPVAPVEKPASRYAAMGIVDAGAGTMPDLDDVLRRRRSG